MKAFNRMMLVVLLVFALIFAGTNFALLSAEDAVGRQYRVDAARAAEDIRAGGADGLDMENYPSLVAVVPVDAGSPETLEGGSSDYLIREIDGSLYRFDYRADADTADRTLTTVNIALGITAAAVLAVLLYIRARIIRPFYLLRDMPYELSRGNLTVPIKEGRHRFFGRFIWGMDMLRDNLEQHRQNELSLQRDRKKLILALSHDIRIPLSAIRLYSKALSKGLYGSPEKQNEIVGKIDEKAGEIEEYVSRIVTASREDFLSLEVKEGEFYLADVVNAISEYYSDKLKLTGTALSIGEYRNCLIKGDRDRAVEVLQNIMENAIKYGDGKRIAISFSSEENCRLVTIANSGCALPRSELPHIFDSFWRGSNASQTGGSGLGLYICRNLMNKMGGEVFAETEGDEMRVTAVFAIA
ncbi:MAG: HAMP domain-containing histidine kinase [Ruminococcaceae bacterium]|nr:HAMP domain-containing histidine kinase [Oscillospiraceae bacterium]